uniref:Conotoxin superfamily W n=1 Tax=Conus ermineus TaxID=55423 RepID=A0A346CJC3_CONER|nr:conotoxin precursor superfamily W [Conus ermineus]
MGAVVGQRWWHPVEGKLTHTSSATKQLLSSVGGLVDGVLHNYVRSEQTLLK